MSPFHIILCTFTTKIRLFDDTPDYQGLRYQTRFPIWCYINILFMVCLCTSLTRTVRTTHHILVHYYLGATHINRRLQSCHTSTYKYSDMLEPSLYRYVMYTLGF
ncbi:hypothetical protein ACJX0J_028292, partial [Zea mays]